MRERREMRSAAPSKPVMFGRWPSCPSLMATVEMHDMGVDGPESSTLKSDGVEGRLMKVGLYRGVNGDSPSALVASSKDGASAAGEGELGNEPGAGAADEAMIYVLLLSLSLLLSWLWLSAKRVWLGRGEGFDGLGDGEVWGRIWIADGRAGGGGRMYQICSWRVFSSFYLLPDARVFEFRRCLDCPANEYRNDCAFLSIHAPCICIHLQNNGRGRASRGSYVIVELTNQLASLVWIHPPGS